MDSIAFPGLNRRNPDEQEDTMAQTQSSTGITDVGRVIVPVADQDRALEFYVGTLGFEKRADTPYGDGERWVEVAPPAAATAIALVPPRAGDSAGVDTRISLTSDDADASHAELRAHGVDVDADVIRMGAPVPPMFFFRDQDGNTLLVVEQA
jgi:catechol 2,3-dioxygenase-like lactoylglutathione lyase family enzyme